MAIELKGAPVAAGINARSQAALEELKLRGILPTLAILRVGEGEDDIAYEAGAMKRCATVGVEVQRRILAESVSQAELMENIRSLNEDSAVHGILLLLPLPKHLDSEAARLALSPEKDVDGITPSSLVMVFSGSGEGYPPCTAQACIEILDHYGIDCVGKRAVIIGRSLVVGKPLSMMLLAKQATVTICHTRTKDMPAVTREAELLIAAAGRAEMVNAEYLSPGQTLIDVGINFVDGRMCGDVDFASAAPIVSALTPVPGGVGTVTTSVLVSHVVEAAARQQAKR